MPLFSPLVPCSFVVCLEGSGVLIYKVKNRKKTFAVFERALFSARFARVVVVHNEKRLTSFLLKQSVLNWYKIETV